MTFEEAFDTALDLICIKTRALHTTNGKGGKVLATQQLVDVLVVLVL